MYKVFFNNSCFLLSERPISAQDINYSYHHEDFESTKAFIEELLHKDEMFTAVIYNEDIEELYKTFKDCLYYVEAAGGVVEEDKNILLIKRLGVFDLPKGHVEKGESIEECAIREVEEECGLKNVKITSYLDSTLHIYYRNDKWHLKRTYWYNMHCSKNSILIPQTEEDIEEVFWLPISEISSVLSQTYASLRSILDTIRRISG